MRSAEAVFGQIVVLSLGLAAAAWGAFGVYGAAFPGPCGDNPGPGLGVIESWVVDVPIGLLALGVGVFVRRGSARLRRMCVVSSVVILALPVAGSVLLQRWHCG
jgi:hypothetical protein